MSVLNNLPEPNDAETTCFRALGESELTRVEGAIYICWTTSNGDFACVHYYDPV